jgi:hypothetical protein
MNNAKAVAAALVAGTVPAVEKVDHVVRFRVGGTARFEWKSSAPMTRTEAFKVLHEVRAMGYAAVVAHESWDCPQTWLYTGTFTTRDIYSVEDMPNDR